MTRRLNYSAIAPAGVKALRGVHAYVAQSNLPKQLLDLVYLRVSQINGCAYCIDMHSRDLLNYGLAVDKLALVPAWRDAGEGFSNRQRIAPACRETGTPTTENHRHRRDYVDA